jgi:exosome complex RNA-binding protein Rrp42 (RNase PH superfamily)
MDDPDNGYYTMNSEVNCPLCEQPVKPGDKDHLAVHKEHDSNMTDVDTKLAQHMMKLENH